ncbi:MAG TPA: NAD(P)/FAD-dependent oxidoreductase [Rhizomicrobium sp.]|jgi:monoamine oxidase|nr:NAD(P)/FAD-dependent oxidoreductase [Rhizomicrobium sp.]
MKVTRRSLLACAAALSMLPPAARAAANADIDVAIIGGGVAGTYAAWRLASEQPRLRLALFEMSDRIGGRLRSIAFPEAPHLVGEAGGMRFLPAHKHVFNLVRQLGLPARGYPVQEPQDHLALRGRSLTYAEAGRPTNLFPYNIPPSDQAPDSPRYVQGVGKVIPGFGHMTPARWLGIRSGLRYKGRLLKDWPSWALEADIFTAEENRFFQDTGGYDIAPLGSALDEFDEELLEADFSKPFVTIAGGYQKLPLALAAEAQHRGARVLTETRLASLSVPDLPGQAFRLGLVDRADRATVLTARRVVLALPRRALELIDDFPARRDPHVAGLIASVVGEPASKAFLLYPRPWWRDLGIDGGRSVTDMPARMFYALGAEKERLASEPANGFGLLMAYCCGPNVQYWQQFAPQAPREAAGFQWLPGNSTLAREIHREAGRTYATEPPAPLHACFQDWTVDPYGGGWSLWRQGVDGMKLADSVMSPLPGRELYICGEAYSPYYQSWAEGAIERTETMLQRHFGLKPPRWLG